MTGDVLSVEGREGGEVCRWGMSVEGREGGEVWRWSKAQQVLLKGMERRDIPAGFTHGRREGGRGGERGRGMGEG